MIPALVLVDMQIDFLARSGIKPSPNELVDRAAFLLGQCRNLGIPVFHVHTVISADASDAMPHWKLLGIRECVRGTPGCSPPEPLLPLNGEQVFEKQFFSAFRDGYLEKALSDINASPVIVAGIFLHGCIRSSIMDAYERGFHVWVPDDATGDDDPVHADVTRQYLSGRAAVFMSSGEILRRLETTPDPGGCSAKAPMPVGYILGRWVPAQGNPVETHVNPSNPEQVLSRVPHASGRNIDEAVKSVKGADGLWQGITYKERSELLELWALQLERSRDELAQAMALELGKPIVSAEEELAFTVKMLRSVVVPAVLNHRALTPVGGRMAECRRAMGVVAIITPWNNPVLIPVGKIAPALGFGNGVVWKPAPIAALTTKILVETLWRSGIPESVFSVLFGASGTSAGLAAHPCIDAVSFTGSCSAGVEMARLCAAGPKPLQAELGGNNGVIIMPDADPEEIAGQLARSAFGFCGQRCTATQRFIVHQDILKEFEKALVAATLALRIGDPLLRDTDLGPVISLKKQQDLKAVVSGALSLGAECLCGGGIPDGLGPGLWFEPTLLFAPFPDLNVVREEIFGPVAVVQSVRNWDEAIWLLNDVRQGLVASLYTHDAVLQEKFQHLAKCGVIKLNQPHVGTDPAMPFTGWKASGLGPPEHGHWDQEFYTRPQALYG